MDAQEFVRDKTIDPTQLDVECVKQADRFFTWAERLVEAKGRLDQAKFQLEIVQASLEIDIRAHPEEHGLLKPTEAAIKASVVLHDKNKAAMQKYMDAKRDVGLLEAAVNAMETKKRMLENLITLHGQQYFAGPSTPRNLVDAWMKEQQTAEDRVNSSQKTKLRRRGEPSE